MGCGRPAGARMPCHVVPSWPGRTDDSGGMSGASRLTPGVVTPSARSLPARMNGSAPRKLFNNTTIFPPPPPGRRRWRRAFVGHMLQFDLGCRIEHLAQQVVERACADRAVGDAARVL